MNGELLKAHLSRAVLSEFWILLDSSTTLLIFEKHALRK